MPKYLPRDLITLAADTGRWCQKELHGRNVLYTTNLGSYLRVNITGSQQVQINPLANQNLLSPAQIYAIRLDQQTWQRYPATSPIKIQLSQAPHLLEIMTAGNTDLDQVWTGNEGFAIQSIDLDQGTLTAAPKRLVVDFIGDSITAGCWVAGKHASYDYRPEANYAAICADDLNVDSVRIAYSAGGVLRPATGGVTTAKHFLTHLDATTPWHANSPQVVVTNLGVNDRRYPIPQFIAAYDQFLYQALHTFPQAQLVIMIPFSQTFTGEIHTLAAKYHLPVIETAGWCRSFTDGLHPDQAGAIDSGHHLSAVLQPFLAE